MLILGLKGLISGLRGLILGQIGLISGLKGLISGMRGLILGLTGLILGQTGLILSLAGLISGLRGLMAWGGDGRTDGRTYVPNLPLCSTGHRPFGAAAQKGICQGADDLYFHICRNFSSSSSFSSLYAPPQDPNLSFKAQIPALRLKYQP